MFIACATANQIAEFDTASARITHCLDVPESPSGLALSRDGARLFVTCAAPASTVCVIAVARRSIIGRMNCNALSVLDLGRWEFLGAVLLDQTTRGAANPGPSPGLPTAGPSPSRTPAATS